MGDSLIGGEEMANHKLRNGIIVLAGGAIIWFMPVPGGLTAQASRLFAVFVATILGFILHPLPLGATAFVALTVCALTNGRADEHHSSRWRLPS